MPAAAARSPLVGRHDECAVLDELVISVRAGGSGVLVLRGEPGIGKTALLNYVLDRATGFRTIRMSGLSSETTLPYAGVLQLCAPLMGDLDTLPRPQRDALATTFGLQPGPAPDTFLVGLAALGLLRAPEHRLLLCVIDDAQWLDTASSRVVAFVARRLLAERVAIVVASRDVDETDDLNGLPTLPVRRLTDHDATRLLRRSMVLPVDTQAQERLLRESHGNPRALLQVPRTRYAVDLTLEYSTPPPPRRTLAPLERAFGARLGQLPAKTRQLLLVAAAEPSGDAMLTWAAGRLLGLDAADAHPALEAGLISNRVRVGDGLLFRHPMVRATVYRTASPEAVREVHRALVSVTDRRADQDRRTWHLAQATVGFDDEIAAALAASAERAQDRGGLGAAAAFLTRATELTGDPEVRARRALAAAQLKHQSGAHVEALSLLSLAETGSLQPLERALTQLTRAQVATAIQHVAQGPDLLLAAVRQLEQLDPTLAQRTYLDALTAALFTSGAGEQMLRDLATALKRAGRRKSRGAHDDLLDAFVVVITEGFPAGAPALRRAFASFLATDPSGTASLQWLALAAHAAHDLWDDQNWADVCSRLVETARQAGALRLLPVALTARMGVHLFAGDLPAVEALADEVHAIGAATGCVYPAYGEIALAAWRGQPSEATPLIDAAIDDIDRRGDDMGRSLVRHAQAVMYNGLGRYSEALVAAADAARQLPELAYAASSLAELVEAASRSDQPGCAQQAVTDLSRVAEASGTDWGLGVLARCKALVTDDPVSAEALYQEAITRLLRTRMPMVLARTQLLYGEWLLSQHRRLEAREPLHRAYEACAHMGLNGFAGRAAAALAATGDAIRPIQRNGPPATLTAQEDNIVRLAATGMTNPEIGAQLFISSRTVEWHLRKVYPRLGISSRKELAVALSAGNGLAVPRPRRSSGGERTRSDAAPATARQVDVHFPPVPTARVGTT